MHLIMLLKLLFLQSNRVEAVFDNIGKLVFDGPVNAAKKVSDAAIMKTMDSVQKALDNAEQIIDIFIISGRNWVDETRQNVHIMLKSLTDTVSLLFFNQFNFIQPNREIDNLNIRQLDRHIDTIKELTEKYVIDLAGCEDIAKQVQRNMVELTDDSIRCVTDRMHLLAYGYEPLRTQLRDVKNVLSQSMKETSECVSNPKNSIMDNLACITAVSDTVFLSTNNFNIVICKYINFGSIDLD